MKRAALLVVLGALLFIWLGGLAFADALAGPFVGWAAIVGVLCLAIAWVFLRSAWAMWTDEDGDGTPIDPPTVTGGL